MQLTATVLVALLNTSVLGLSPGVKHSHDLSSATVNLSVAANISANDTDEALTKGPCPVYASKPYCCDSALLGLVFSGCKAPKDDVSRGEDLLAACVSRGKLAKCCPSTLVCSRREDLSLSLFVQRTCC